MGRKRVVNRCPECGEKKLMMDMEKEWLEEVDEEREYKWHFWCEGEKDGNEEG